MAGSLPLRERKKMLTRSAIVTAARQLFEERGFDNVTVAEIADAANVSVKTLFVYFRSKEDLAFSGNRLLDTLIADLRAAPRDASPAAVVAETLVGLMSPAADPDRGLEGYHRGYGSSPALQTGLLRMWADFEDRLTAYLAERAGTPATADHRFLAMRLIAMARTVTSPELRASVVGLSREDAAARIATWLRTASTR